MQRAEEAVKRLFAKALPGLQEEKCGLVVAVDLAVRGVLCGLRDRCRGLALGSTLPVFGGASFRVVLSVELRRETVGRILRQALVDPVVG